MINLGTVQCRKKSRYRSKFLRDFSVSLIAPGTMRTPQGVLVVSVKGGTPPHGGSGHKHHTPLLPKRPGTVVTGSASFGGANNIGYILVPSLSSLETKAFHSFSLFALVLQGRESTVRVHVQSPRTPERYCAAATAGVHRVALEGTNYRLVSFLPGAPQLCPLLRRCMPPNQLIQVTK